MNYAREELIGRGGMSEVYRGRALTDDLAAAGLPQGAPVALKYLNDQYLADAEIKERFFQEAQLCNRLQNPNIVRVHDVDLDGDRPFLVMDLVSGESLRARLRRGALPENEAVAIALGVLRALEAAHAAGIIHRDIKPGNILPGPGKIAPEAVRVTDFGIAKVLGGAALTVVGTQLGTPDYMSPEQMMGGRVDARCDLYSLGVVLYEMLSGSTPFAAATSAEVSRRVLSEAPPPLPPTVSRRVREVVLRALQKDPTARYPSARDMRAVLELVQLQPLQAPPLQVPIQTAAAASPVASSVAVSPRIAPQAAPKPIEYSIAAPRSQNETTSTNSRSLMTWGALGLGALLIVALAVGQNTSKSPIQTVSPSVPAVVNETSDIDNLVGESGTENNVASPTPTDDAQNSVAPIVALTPAITPQNVVAPTPQITPTPEVAQTPGATPIPKATAPSQPVMKPQVKTISRPEATPRRKISRYVKKHKKAGKRPPHVVHNHPKKIHKTKPLRPKKNPPLHSYVF